MMQTALALDDVRLSVDFRSSRGPIGGPERTEGNNL